MKKVLALLSLTAFLAVNVNAQTSRTVAPIVKKEASAVQDQAKEVKAEAKTEAKAAAGKSCCVKANASCCKNNKEAKNCTAEQKAACAKSAKECSSHAKVSKELKEIEKVKVLPIPLDDIGLIKE